MSATRVVVLTVIIGAYVRERGWRNAIGELCLGLFVLGMVPAPFLALGGWTVAGLAIGLCYGMQLIPAVVAACRTRELHGVAPSTGVMAWGEAVIWLVYGCFAFDIALLTGGASGALGAGIILARLWLTGHQPFTPASRRVAVV